jgi:uncharacterized protein YjcR
MIAVYLDHSTLAKRWGVHRNTVMRWAELEGFPKPYVFGTGKTPKRLYALNDILTWERSRYGAAPGEEGETGEPGGEATAAPESAPSTSHTTTEQAPADA